MTWCDEASIPGCVRDSPFLGFSAVGDPVVAGTGFFVLALATYGLEKYTGGILGAISRVFSVLKPGSKRELAVYFAVTLLMALLVVVQILDKEYLSSFVAVVVASILVASGLKNALSYHLPDFVAPVLNGAFVGVVLGLVLWLVNHFRISSDNLVGDLFGLFISVYWLGVVMAMAGSLNPTTSTANRGRETEGRKKETRAFFSMVRK